MLIIITRLYESPSPKNVPAVCKTVLNIGEASGVCPSVSNIYTFKEDAL
jgi:hypothetical protein